MPNCQHGLPFEVRCPECFAEAMNRVLDDVPKEPKPDKPEPQPAA